MHVIFHIGAHCTDEDRLLNSMLKNQGLLNAHGVIVPEPRQYRKLILRTIKYLRGAHLTRFEQKELLEEISGNFDADRLILSSEDFLTYKTKIFANQSLYGNVTDRISALTDLFAASRVEFHLCVRNPATFIPAVFARTKKLSFTDFLNGTDVNDVKWSPMIRAICKASPKSKMTVWCYEDAPLIWSHLMYDMTDVDTRLPLNDEASILELILTGEGARRCQSYLEEHPPRNELQRRRVIRVFLRKYALPATLGEKMGIPEWTQDKIDELTGKYEEDIYEILRIPGVSFIGA